PRAGTGRLTQLVYKLRATWQLQPPFAKHQLHLDPGGNPSISEVFASPLGLPLAGSAARVELGRESNRLRVVPGPASDLNLLCGSGPDRHNGLPPRRHLRWLALLHRRSAAHRAHAKRDDRRAPRPGFPKWCPDRTAHTAARSDTSA